MWNNGKHPPMPPRERAKQFVPFAAVRGLEDALRERERITDMRVEIQQDAAEEMDGVLRALVPKDRVQVTYYADGRYVTKTGCICAVCAEEKFLVIENREKISFSDLRCIERIFDENDNKT